MNILYLVTFSFTIIMGVAVFFIFKLYLKEKDEESTSLNNKPQNIENEKEEVIDNKNQRTIFEQMNEMANDPTED